MAKSSTIQTPSGNLLNIFADPIVVATGAGVLAGHLSRKALITSQRPVFGTAVRELDSSKPTGRVIYVDTTKPKDADGNFPQVANAYQNRIFLALGQVLVGTLIIGTSQDANLDLVGAGFAAGGLANVIMAVLNLE